MSVVILDTSVASLLHPRRSASALCATYATHLQGRILALSFQSVAELWGWAEARSWGESQRRSLALFIGRFLVIPYDDELAQVWARVSVHCARRGRRLEAGDAWILATAVCRGVPLVTHDRDHLGLEVPGLQVISHAEEYVARTRPAGPRHPGPRRLCRRSDPSRSRTPRAKASTPTIAGAPLRGGCPSRSRTPCAKVLSSTWSPWRMITPRIQGSHEAES